MKKNKKIYHLDFKKKVVKLSYESNCIKKIEQEFNLYPGAIARWRKAYAKFALESYLGEVNLAFNPDKERIHSLEKKIKQLNLKSEILRNSRTQISQGKSMMFNFILSNEKTYSNRLLCEVLGINRCTYRSWRNQCVTKTQKRKILLKKEITKIFFAFKQRYGSPRITIELQKLGYQISCSTVNKYMNELGLSTKLKNN